MLNYKDHILPTKIKSGKTGTLKSLQIFIKEHDPKIAIRFSEQSLSFYNKILSILFYLISQTQRLFNELL